LITAKYYRQRFDIAGKRGPEHLKFSGPPRVFHLPVSISNNTLHQNSKFVRKSQTLSTGAAAGIAVSAMTILLLGVAIALCLRTHRRQRRAADRERAPETYNQTASPFSLGGEIESSHRSVSKAAVQDVTSTEMRRGLDAQLATIYEPAAHLDLENPGRRVATSSVPLRLIGLIPRRNKPVGSVRRTYAGRSEVDAEPHATREGINLVRQINALEAKHDSSWEAEEAPPAYV
jgi:hypothetical protein